MNKPKNKIQIKNCIKVEAKKPIKEPAAAFKARLWFVESNSNSGRFTSLPQKVWKYARVCLKFNGYKPPFKDEFLEILKDNKLNKEDYFVLTGQNLNFVLNSRKALAWCIL